MMLLLAILGCSYDAPVRPNESFEGVPNTISGTVVVNGLDTDDTGAFIRGDVVLLLTDADNPMPPNGTGRPATFATVRAEDFTGSGAGLQSAPFSLSFLPPAGASGSWVLTGFMDLDADFHPSVSALAGATCGDYIGAHLQDLNTGQLAPIRVDGGQLIDDVTVTLGIQLTSERPAFWLPQGTPVLSRDLAVADPTAQQTITVSATAIHGALSETLAYDLEGPFDPAAPAPCQTAFLTEVRDLTGPDDEPDGLPDLHPDYGDLGLFDIGPSFVLQYLGELTVDDQGVVNGYDASVLQPGESWAMQALVHPEMLVFGELGPTGVPTLIPELELLWLPGGLHTNADGTVETVLNPLDLPTGAWSLTVIEATGQTWTVPNEMLYAVPTADDFYPLTQGAFIVVQ